MAHGAHRISRHAACYRTVAILLTSFLVLATAPAVAGNGRAVRLEEPAGVLRRDAELGDVFFVDETTGWAVGTRGTIWHTQSGGEHWHLQSSGVDCPLLSVWFVDRNHGWVAGGEPVAFTQAARGVLLSTADGGRSWRREEAPGLPVMRKILFFGRHGVAIGNESPLYPSGVIRTDDAGQTWSESLAGPPSAWHTAAVLRRDAAVIAPETGPPVVVQRGRAIVSKIADTGGRKVRAIEFADERTGWLVGDGGLVRTTSDGGRSWHAPPSPLPEGISRHFDLASLSVRDSHLWIAGSPGTLMIHSPDGGRSWSLLATGTTLPIRAVQMVDHHRGWAVGAFGTILATRDGGRTWRIQRTGGRRAAVLALYAQPRDVPLELLASVSLSGGYLSAAQVFGAGDGGGDGGGLLATIGDAEMLRTTQAATTVGASSVVGPNHLFARLQRFDDATSPSAEKSSSDATARAAFARAEEHLVRQIRLWQPSLILTHGPDSERRDAQWIGQLVLSAVQKAADRDDPLRLEALAGLPPWQVKKVVSTRSAKSVGALDVATDRLDPRLGATLADAALRSRGMIRPDDPAGPPVVGLTLLVDRTTGRDGGRDLTSGITLDSGGPARRADEPVGAPSFSALRDQMTVRRQVDEAIRGAASPAWPATSRIARVQSAVRSIAPEDAAILLFGSAHQLHRDGRTQQAALLMDQLVKQSPRDPLRPAALLWLAQFHASAEVAHQTRRIPGADAPATRSEGPLPGAANASRIVPAGAGPESESADRPLAPLSRLAGYVQRTDHVLIAQPEFRFALAAAARKEDNPNAAVAEYNALRRMRDRDRPWWDAGKELRLAARPDHPPGPFLSCPRAKEKPYLDGRLDDPLWQKRSAVELGGSPTEQSPPGSAARVMLAYDSEFLYIAATCRKHPHVGYPEPTAVRERDPNLAHQDRIEIWIDVDRDYTTGYQLVIDHRGFVQDRCWHSPAWNPKWFVARTADEQTWNIEAAMPLSELVPRAPVAGEVWSLGVARVIPGARRDHWRVGPSAPGGGSDRGFLLFP